MSTRSIHRTSRWQAQPNPPLAIRGRKPAKESPVTTRHDLTSVQQAIWLDQLLAPDVPSYNIGIAWRIDGDLDEARYEAAIDEVTRSHDALRLVMGEEAGVPFQCIAARAGCIAPRLDLSGHGD